MLYRIFFNKKRVLKWQNELSQRKQNLKNLKLNLAKIKQNIAFFKQIAPQSAIWLKSREFKAKYIDTKHPFPPLLNPDKIDYKSISADFAWELNLPLPRNYEYIYLMIYANASGAGVVYLQKCGFALSDGLQENDCDYKKTYESMYKFLLNHKRVILRVLEYDYNEKFMHLIDDKKPIFLITRDPLGNAKTLSNHTGPKADKIREFNLGVDYKKVLDYNLKYDNDEPKFGDFADFIMKKIFCDLGKYLLYFKENEKIIIDTQDLKKDKLVKTFENLSKKMNFSMPKDDLTNIENTTLLLHWLNVFLYLNDSENKGIKILIATPFLLNVFHEPSKYELLKGFETKDFKLYILKNEAKMLYENNKLFDKTKSYLIGFCEYLQNKIEQENKRQIKEENLLEFFAKNEEKFRQYKAIFDENLSYFKQNYPKIVASWKFYAKFEEICLN